LYALLVWIKTGVANQGNIGQIGIGIIVAILILDACKPGPARFQTCSIVDAVVGVIFPPVSSTYIIHTAVTCLRLLMQTIPRPYSLARERAGNNKATNRHDHNHPQQFKFEMTGIRDKPRLSG